VIETGASDLADMLLRCKFIINVYSEVSNNMHWLDDVMADCKRSVNAGQLQETLSCSDPHELRLQHIELQSTRGTPTDHISDTVTQAPKSGLNFGSWCRDIQLFVICEKMVIDTMTIHHVYHILGV
jgi:hypothetical protein